MFLKSVAMLLCAQHLRRVTLEPKTRLIPKASSKKLPLYLPKLQMPCRIPNLVPKT